MRRDALDRAIKAIHWKVPKWFFKRCDQCGDDVKGEQMWWVRRCYSVMNQLYSKVWTCRRCCPLMSDYFKAHAAYYDREYGVLDLTCIIEEERQLRHQRGATDATTQ